MSAASGYDTWEVEPIEKASDNPQTPAPPESIVILATAEIVVKDPLGTYLIMICPRYEPLQSNEPFGESGQWTPPYAVRKVAWGAQEGCSLKRMLERADEKWPLEGSKAEMKDMMDRWYTGLRNPTLHNQFFEYKRSWAMGGSRRVYLIRRYTFDREDAEPRALADRELLRGFRFLPLDEARYEQGADTYDCDFHGREHRTFMGRPLATNIEYITKDEQQRETLRQRAIPLPVDAFVDEHAGLILVGDLANYGAACAYYADHMGSPELPGATRLRQRIANALTALFSRCGIAHVQTAGDGFVCGIPDRPRPRLENLEQFLEAYIAFVAEVRKLDDEIHTDARRPGRPVPPRLGTRLGMTAGGYAFGKTGLAAAAGPAFDGDDVVVAARLEGALSTYTRETGQAALLHTVALGSTAQPELAEHLASRLDTVGTFVAKAKEFTDRTAMLYRVRPPTD
jgi:hypothetical protein